MLSRERFELQVGLTFVIAIFLLVVGILWAKRIRPEAEEYVIHILFPQVGGLMEGDAVLVSGLRLGNVKDIELRTNGEVFVTAVLERKIDFSENYRVQITMMNFTGEMGLSISTGNGPPLDPMPDVLIGEPPFELTAFIQPAVETLRSINHAADTLVTVIPAITGRTNQTLDRLDAVLLNVDDGIMEGRGSLRTTLDSARVLMATLNGKVATGSVKAESLMVSLQATSERLRAVVAAIDTTDGTLGLMIRDPHLYQEMIDVTARLDSVATTVESLADDLKRNPKRYVHFSLF